MKTLKKVVFVILLVLVIGFGIERVTVSKSSGSVEYFPLGAPQLIIKKGTAGSFDCKRTHTLSIVELNKDGYRFWGYYTGWDGVNFKNDMGLVCSNDLVHWDKASTKPVVANLRWATAVVSDGIIHLYGTRGYGENSYISHFTSEDGKNFVEHETVAGPANGEKYQNPFIFYDENTATYRLYYFHALDDIMFIEEKHSADIEHLSESRAKRVLSSKTDILAAPSMVYRDGKYWLTAETLVNPKTAPKWETLAYVSSSPVRGFIPVNNQRILVNDDACLFQYVFDNRLNAVYSHRYSDDTWEMYNRVYDLANHTNINVSEANVELKKGDSRQLNVETIFANENNKNITSQATWATSDNTVVSVRKGKITALKEGTATITVSYGGASKTTFVKVSQ